jgi:hypothetical protein
MVSPILRTQFDIAREAYRPQCIKYLLVAEAPPNLGSDRFFYFPKVATQDSLFLETMKTLYPHDCTGAADIRPRKGILLERFKRDGCFLIDAVDQPLADSAPAYKRQRIRECLPSLLAKIRANLQSETGVILISSRVYEVCAAPLRRAGVPVLNTDLIDFPGSGGQRKFREKLRRLLNASLTSV